MTTRHRQHLPCIEESRRANQAIIDRSPEPVVSPADVTYRSKSTIQRKTQHPHGVRSSISIPCRIHSLPVHIREIRVDMCIDHARHERAAPYVNYWNAAGPDWLV